MHQSKIQLDAAADAFKEDFGIDVASHTGSILMLLNPDVWVRLMAIEGNLIERLTQKTPVALKQMRVVASSTQPTS